MKSKSILPALIGITPLSGFAVCMIITVFTVVFSQNSTFVFIFSCIVAAIWTLGSLYILFAVIRNFLESKSGDGKQLKSDTMKKALLYLFVVAVVYVLLTLCVDVRVNSYFNPVSMIVFLFVKDPAVICAVTDGVFFIPQVLAVIIACNVADIPKTRTPKNVSVSEDGNAVRNENGVVTHRNYLD